MRRDIRSENDFAIAFAPAVHSSTVAVAGVDLQGYEGAEAVIQVGTVTDGTHTPKLQESDDNSTWTDVAAANLNGAFVALASNTVQRVGYIGSKRYIGIVVTVTGSPATGAAYGGTIHRAQPWNAPLA
jgi:hypothetical protein